MRLTEVGYLIYRESEYLESLKVWAREAASKSEDAKSKKILACIADYLGSLLDLGEVDVVAEKLKEAIYG